MKVHIFVSDREQNHTTNHEALSLSLHVRRIEHRRQVPPHFLIRAASILALIAPDWCPLLLRAGGVHSHLMEDDAKDISRLLGGAGR